MSDITKTNKDYINWLKELKNKIRSAPENELVQQAVAQITWVHNIVISNFQATHIQKPIGVSEYIITRNLPDEYKSSLPTIEEIEAELGGLV